MITLNQTQKESVSRVLTWDNYGNQGYAPSDIIGVEKKEDFYCFKTSFGMHPIHKETYQEYKSAIESNQPKVENKPEPVKYASEEPNEVIPIASSNSNTVYLVAPQQQTCTCKGFQYRHHCKHLHQINGEQLAKIAKDYGYEVAILENSYSVVERKYGKTAPVLSINLDKNTKTYWYRPSQNFSTPAEAFKTWAKRNYKQPKLSRLIKLGA